MRPALRLAISSVFSRRSRSLLLVGSVALSAAMIAAVSCAMASIGRAVETRLDQTIGRADVRIRAASGSTVPDSLLERARAWPQTRAAVGRLQESLGVRFVRPMWDRETGLRQVAAFTSLTTAFGIDAAREPDVRIIRMREGRLPEKAGEIAIDTGMVEWLSGSVKGALTRGRTAAPAASEPPRGAGPEIARDGAEADRLNREYSLKLGDRVEVVRLFRQPTPLTVVGVFEQPPFGGRHQCYMALPDLAEITKNQGRLTQVDVVLGEGIDPNAAVLDWRAELGEQYLVQTTERITSGLEKNMRSNDLGFVLATMMAFLAASFIIMTGLSTGVVERQRELAILRCIGATRAQLAVSQLMGGLAVGGLGAAIGVPLGVAFAGIMAVVFEERLPAGLAIAPSGLAAAVVGSLVSGLAGAAYPAWRAARVSPLEGLAVRARPVRMGAIWTLLACGLAGVVIHLLVVLVPRDGQVAFWGYATVGLPAMFIGYFLLGVPVLFALTRLVGPFIGRLMGLPPRLLERTVTATPYRYGFTAGAMMSGLALMVAMWTQGHAILNDWLGRLDFPDAFVTGLNLRPESRARLESLEFVEDTCAITLQPIETDMFGVKALQNYKSMFIAFEPERFFRMTHLTWVEPTTQEGQQRARERLAEGGAILVAREFQVAQGLGVGGTFRAKTEGASHDFEIVGVVTSPGLEVVSQFFSIGEEFTDQAIHAVFGSRRDLKERFGSEAITLIQINLADDVDDDEAVGRIRSELADAGVLDAGSGRKIKEEIRVFVGGTLMVTSSIAVFTMLVSSFGVANIIVAGVHARQFEFGVLRALGAQRGLVTRLVMAEAALIAAAACVLGTLMGIQGIFAGQRLDRLLFGLELTVRPPPLPIAVGWAFVFAVTLGAAAPTVIALARKRPRELLGAVRG